jgi:uncharacterized Zn finger protein
MDIPNLPQQDMEKILRDAPTIKCSECGHGAFHEVVIFKHLSELLSPSGKAGAVPIPTFACDSCSAINDAFLPPFLKTAKVQQATVDEAKQVISTPRLEIVK